MRCAPRIWKLDKDRRKYENVDYVSLSSKWDSLKLSNVTSQVSVMAAAIGDRRLSP